MLFCKNISLPGIAKHLLGPDSPVPSHAKSVKNSVEKGIDVLYQHIISINGVDSFLGPSTEAFSTISGLKKTSEIFSSIVVAHLIGQDPRFDRAVSYVGTLAKSAISATEGTWNFFLEEKLKRSLPNDLDCTGLAIPLVLRDLPPLQLNRLGRLILNNTVKPASDRVIPEGAEGVLQVYFPQNREVLSRSNRIDPCVCINGIYGLLYLLKNEHIDLDQLKERGGIKPSLAYILDHLKTDATGSFDKITRYYPHPEEFLFFLSRLVSEHSTILDQIFPNFSTEAKTGIEIALRTRISAGEDTNMPAAMRILIAKMMTLPINLDRERAMLLEALAAHEGVLPGEAFFGCGQAKILFGSPWVTTAFALAALEFKQEQTYFSDIKTTIKNEFSGSDTPNPTETLTHALAPDHSRENTDALGISSAFLEIATSLHTQEEVSLYAKSVYAWRGHIRSQSFVSEELPKEIALPPQLSFLLSLENPDTASTPPSFLRRFGVSLKTLLEEIPLAMQSGKEKTPEFYTKFLSAHFDLWTTLNFAYFTADVSLDRNMEFQTTFDMLGHLFFIQNTLVLFATEQATPHNIILKHAKEQNLSVEDAATQTIAQYRILKETFMAHLSKVERTLEYIAENESQGLIGAKEVLTFFRNLPEGYGRHLTTKDMC